MFDSPFHYFTDAVLRAPTLGSMLMCFGAALVGVIVFLRKQSLVGEALSHAAYPGVILGVLIASLLQVNDSEDTVIEGWIIGGALASACTGLWVIHQLERKWRVPPDSALCFVLSAFFGWGITLASYIQGTHTSFYRKVQVYLYGQVATMTDRHIMIYGFLAAVFLLIIVCFHKEWQTMTFDRAYAKSLGIPIKRLGVLINALIVTAVVIGIRSVGVVLMSAMLIAPAAAARQFTNKLSVMFLLAAVFGAFSGFAGNYLSVELTQYMSHQYQGLRLALSTGPMIVLVASFICLASLFFAPERGIVWRFARIRRFRHKCLIENILKFFWRQGSDRGVSIKIVREEQNINIVHLHCILYRLKRHGLIETSGPSCFRLTNTGKRHAAKIVRLHRLWELYLTDYLGVGADRVHRSAEEMEHILTPDLERELTRLLNNPLRDPHQQPIPELNSFLDE